MLYPSVTRMSFWIMARLFQRLISASRLAASDLVGKLFRVDELPWSPSDGVMRLASVLKSEALIDVVGVPDIISTG